MELGVHLPQRFHTPPTPPQVREMLASFRLEQYADRLDEEGYDDLDFLMQIRDDADLVRSIAESVGMRPGHAHKFCQLLPRYAPNTARTKLFAPWTN